MNSETDPELTILKAMEENMRFHMTYFAKYVATVELYSQNDVVVVRSDIADDTFNYVISAHFNKDELNNRVSEILKIFKNPPVPFSWWVGPSAISDILINTLLSHGLIFLEENVGMYLYLNEFAPSLKKNTLTFQRVRTLSDLKDFSSVVSNNGGHPEIFDKLYSKILPFLYQEEACFEMYTAYLEKVPIVTGILLLHANVAGIYYVITEAKYRKNGYGTEMMAYLLQRAKIQGYSLATLQASEDGKGLYRRLGFQECGVFKEYSGAHINGFY
jgi:ribosomal protein S18 acetylase RimI-like enzyme